MSPACSCFKGRGEEECDQKQGMISVSPPGCIEQADDAANTVDNRRVLELAIDAGCSSYNA